MATRDPELAKELWPARVDEGGMETTLPSFLAPNLPPLVIPCRPFGCSAVLVLVLPVTATSLLAAFWAWGSGLVAEAVIGRA